jgi:hypothetical protein
MADNTGNPIDAGAVVAPTADSAPYMMGSDLVQAQAMQGTKPLPPPSTDDTHTIHMVDPNDGQVGLIPPSQVEEAKSYGYTVPSSEQVAKFELVKKYGDQGGTAALEGLGQGLLGPVVPAIEEGLGVDPRDIRGRAEVHPGKHFVGEVGGLLLPTALTGGANLAAKAGLTGASDALSGAAGLTQAAFLEKVGTGVTKIAQEYVPQTLAGQIGTAAAKASVENMLLAGSDETSKMILNDPNQSAQTAAATVGLSGLLGGAVGGGLQSLSPLWERTGGRLAADFFGRADEHINNPDPVASVTEEVRNFHNGIKSMADEVYGPSGLKAADVAKALPTELTPAITEQGEQISRALSGSISDMIKDPSRYPARLTSRLQGDLDAFTSKASTGNVTDVFNATQDLKQSLQGYAKFDKFVKPVDEAYDFVNTAKNLAYDLRSKLEDTNVWAGAATRQQAINKAFTEYLPALKDFEKRFTTDLLTERVVDPSKINIYMNQLGKPSAEIKQEMLGNFIDASKKYQNVIRDTHTNLGIESPIVDTPLNATMATLGKQTTGAKLFDILLQKGVKEGGSKGLGAGIGGILGHYAGHMEMGSMIGAYSLGPFFKTVLPAIAGAILKNRAASGAGLEAATNYGLTVARGDGLLTKAAKNVFRLGSDVIPSSMFPNEASRSKLDKMLKHLQTNPQQLLSADNNENLGHYLPDHASSASQTAGTAAQYLNSLRPNQDPKNPLDAKPVLSATTKAQYDNALNVAQQPMIVLDKIQKGTLNVQDIKTLSTIYPALYTGMRQKLLNEVMDATEKGKTIPYKTRTALSLFMGQPLDSTMTPASIQSIQSVQSGQQSSQQQAPQGAGPKRSTASLSKMPNMYATPNQTAEGRRNKQN